MKSTLFMQFAAGEEYRLCLRCRANLRYEMLAEHLRQQEVQLKDVVELDRDLPLRPLLTGSRSYTRTFYDPNHTLGFVATDGSQMEDITRLTFRRNSVDLMISSDVLEHVPDLAAAFAEMHRVLRHGGLHLFTVPAEPHTRQLATIEHGQIKQLVHPPEYHGDPLGQHGILAYWHLGPDFPQLIDVAGLKLSIVKGPEGTDRRIIWQAQR